MDTSTDSMSCGHSWYVACLLPSNVPGLRAAPRRRREPRTAFAGSVVPTSRTRSQDGCAPPSSALSLRLLLLLLLLRCCLARSLHGRAGLKSFLNGRRGPTHDCVAGRNGVVRKVGCDMTFAVVSSSLVDIKPALRSKALGVYTRCS